MLIKKQQTGGVMNNRGRISGFSLVELLVALLVGSIIVSGAFSLFATSRKTQQVNESQMDMVADARFAIQMIAYDLRHAGMWGSTNKTELVACRSTDPDCVSTGGETIPVAAVGDCAAGWYYNLSVPIFAFDDTAGNPYEASCLPASEGYLGGTDILEIRYADPNLPAAGLSAGQTYVRSNFINGKVFIGVTEPKLPSNDTGPGDPITSNHILHAYAYYISDHSDSAGDNIPSLRRISLVSGPLLDTQMLVSGVVDLQVQFGEDTVNYDGVVDKYVDPNNVSDWDAVYSAKIWLLMRSDKKQIGVNTTKSFVLAGKPAVPYGGQNDYRYFLVTGMVNLRNIEK